MAILAELRFLSMTNKVVTNIIVGLDSFVSVRDRLRMLAKQRAKVVLKVISLMGSWP